jgi:hypothetical protein
MQNKRLWIVEDGWNESYCDELSVFPYGAHDDQVDCTVYALLTQIAKYGNYKQQDELKAGVEKPNPNMRTDEHGQVYEADDFFENQSLYD